jgi:endonuclease/exonuclease/phosphatase family metal-dependent hydrolase
MPFTVATYNVLAGAYVRPEWYPRTPAPLLAPEHRIPALAEHLAALDADLFCLQEVEETVMDALRRPLARQGYGTAAFLLKDLGKPDGCAFFLRDGRFASPRFSPVRYADDAEGQPPSGHVALVLAAEVEGRCLALANTHLKWDPPGTPRERQYGYRQVCRLLEARQELVPEAEGWIVCGDLNVTAQSEVVRALQEAGFSATPPVGSGGPTANPNGRAKRIDWLFHDEALTAEPLPRPVVEDDTPLPGPGEPSDHVAVASRFNWREPGRLPGR